MPSDQHSWPGEDPTWDIAAVGRQGQPLVPARLHAEPEPVRRLGRQRHGPLGLRPLVLAASTERRPGARPRRQPATTTRPPGRGSRSGSPVRPTRRSCPRRSWTRRSSTARRTRTSRCTAQGLPLAHPERVQRPHAQPAAVLRAVEQVTMMERQRSPDHARQRAKSRWSPAVAASQDTSWPATWPTDGRDGGVPDPRRHGRPQVDPDRHRGRLPAQRRSSCPTRRSATTTTAATSSCSTSTNKTLCLGPAERADVIVDFSQVPKGAKLILYNDAPAPVPAFDPRYDYYTRRPRPDARPAARPAPRPATAPTRARSCSSRWPATRTPTTYDLRRASRQADCPAAYKASTRLPPIVPETALCAPATDTLLTASRTRSST